MRNQYQRCPQCFTHRFSRYLRERAYWWSLGVITVAAMILGGPIHV